MDEFNKSNEVRKRKFRDEIMRDLNDIRGSLQEMLTHNRRVAEHAPLEELERDEFVVDVTRRDKLWEDCDKVCKDIRLGAEQNILMVQLLKDRV